MLINNVTLIFFSFRFYHFSPHGSLGAESERPVQTRVRVLKDKLTQKQNKSSNQTKTEQNNNNKTTTTTTTTKKKNGDAKARAGNSVLMGLEYGMENTLKSPIESTDFKNCV